MSPLCGRQEIALLPLYRGRLLWLSSIPSDCLCWVSFNFSIAFNLISSAFALPLYFSALLRKPVSCCSASELSSRAIICSNRFSNSVSSSGTTPVAFSSALNFFLCLFCDILTWSLTLVNIKCQRGRIIQCCTEPLYPKLYFVVLSLFFEWMD